MIKPSLDISELPRDLLLKSRTYVECEELFGRCTRCGEMTGLLTPCCDASVDFEGGYFTADFLWDCVAQEIADQLPKPINTSDVNALGSFIRDLKKDDL